MVDIAKMKELLNEFHKESVSNDKVIAKEKMIEDIVDGLLNPRITQDTKTVNYRTEKISGPYLVNSNYNYRNSALGLKYQDCKKWDEWVLDNCKKGINYIDIHLKTFHNCMILKCYKCSLEDMVNDIIKKLHETIPNDFTITYSKKECSIKCESVMENTYYLIFKIELTK